jgi:transcriptional regulator GlxA family with amidase domain
VRPRWSRCGECGGSHVLLPVFALLRRADAVGVIGAALAARAAGAGARRAAAVVGRPIETVRGWLRCFAHRAEVVRVVFTALLVGVGVDPVPPAAMSSAFADAVAAVVGASAAVRSRWPEVGELPLWALVSAVTGGRLLTPGWP